jgi:hypothetical protein
MEDLKTTKKTRQNKLTNGSSTKKTPSKTSTEVGDVKQEVEIFSHVDLLNYWGKWIPQYIVVDSFMSDWVVCQHWYSTNSHNEQFSQLGSPLIVKKDRIRLSSEKANRPLPWDWYKDIPDFVRFCKSRVGGIGQPRDLVASEKAAYLG